MPETIHSHSVVTGIEIDPLTARIAKVLYPERNRFLALIGDRMKTRAGLVLAYHSLAIRCAPCSEIL